MKYLTFILLLNHCFFCTGQTFRGTALKRSKKASTEKRKIPEAVKEGRYQLLKVDTTVGYTARKPTESFIDFEKDSTKELEAILCWLIRSKNSNQQDSLKRSAVLNQLSSMTVYRSTNLSRADAKKKKRIKKKLQRIFAITRCSFGTFTYYAVNVPLVQQKGTYYYNKNGEDGGYQLYQGVRPKKTKEDPEPEEFPLPLITENQAYKHMFKELKRIDAIQELKKGKVSFFGYYLLRDKKSLHRKRIPQIKIVILLGTKRLCQVKRAAPEPIKY